MFLRFKPRSAQHLISVDPQNGDTEQLRFELEVVGLDVLEISTDCVLCRPAPDESEHERTLLTPILFVYRNGGVKRATSEGPSDQLHSSASIGLMRFLCRWEHDEPALEFSVSLEATAFEALERNIVSGKVPELIVISFSVDALCTSGSLDYDIDHWSKKWTLPHGQPGSCAIHGISFSTTLFSAPHQ